MIDPFSILSESLVSGQGFFLYHKGKKLSKLVVMPIIAEELRDRVQTGREIAWLARNYWPDLDESGDLDKPLPDYYRKVKSIPYQEDGRDEVVARPKFLMDRTNFPALDCKKKAVLISSWLEAHGIPWRLVTTSELPSKEIHHIFPQMEIDGEWYPVDATYPEYDLWEPKPEVTAAEEILV